MIGRIKALLERRGWDDAELLSFGNDQDMTIGFDGTQLEVLPKTHDTGAMNFGDGTTDADVKFFMGSTTEYLLMDVGNSRVYSGVPIQLDNGTATANSALLMGAGTNGDPATTSSADTNFLEFRLENSATSGDNRGMYLRLTFTGEGAGGEALRAYTNVTDVAGSTAHGAHLSLDFGTTGSITGLGCGSRSTLHIPNSAMSGGTYCGAMSELYADGASSDISGTTNHSIHRFNLGGNETGRETATTVFEFVNLTSGTAATDMIKTDQHAGDATDGLRVIINGTPYWILLSSS